MILFNCAGAVWVWTTVHLKRLRTCGPHPHSKINCALEAYKHSSWCRDIGYFHMKCIQNSADMRYYQNLILIHCCLHKQSHITWHITQNPILIIVSIFSQSLRVIGILELVVKKIPIYLLSSPFWWHPNIILVLSPFRYMRLYLFFWVSTPYKVTQMLPGGNNL